MSISLQSVDTEQYSTICIDSSGAVLAEYVVKSGTDPKVALDHVSTMLSGLAGDWVLSRINGSISERKGRGSS